MLLRCFPALGCLVLGLLLPTAPVPRAAAAESKPSLAARVKSLVDQLGDPDRRKAALAEAALLELGPEVLPLLPPAQIRLTVRQSRRLEGIISVLKDISPRTFTFKAKAVSLSAALTALKKQTGMEVSDKRLVKTNPELSLDLVKVTFWEALDAIAREARVAVSLYQGEGQLALVDGAYRSYPASYSGLFRTVVKRVTVTRDLETGAHYGVVHLEVAWEPRLRPFYLDQGPDSISFPNARGKTETVAQEGKGQTAVHGRNSLELTVQFPAPPRTVRRLDALKGSFTVISPSKMLTFTFDKLARIARANQARLLKQEGVTVRLTRLVPDDDPWDVGITLDYPPGGVKFDSYQSWLGNNEIFLENVRTRLKQRPLQGGEQVNNSTYPHADILYFFGNNKPRLGKPAAWKLVYRTPGRIVPLHAQFEFKDLTLP